jgi:Leucine-rich repeat (LRR) protein
MNFPNLKDLHCFGNNLTHLPENMNFPNLKYLGCYNNNLKHLPENMNFPNLQELGCRHNKLTHLPENMNFPNLQALYCSHNKLTHLPLWLMNCRYLEYLEYHNNEIVLSPQMTRFINRLRQGNLQSLSIYNDGQNIHNSNIQLSVKESIDRITTRLDLVTYNKDKLHTIIIEDDILNCKEQLIEYCNDDSVHSLLLLTFPEVLWYVLMTIIKDFNIDTQQEIKSILNDEMKDTLCKCFTGRMSRIINCLNGFSELVQIEIKNESQIGNIIVLVRDRLIDNYSIEKHKEEVRIELEERGYSSETIEEWVSYIE